jgi:hypothetical protein
MDTGREDRTRNSKSRSSNDRVAAFRISTSRPSVPRLGRARQLMFDLQVLALQADVTRVITFQMAGSKHAKRTPESGINEAHHPIAHHGNSPKSLSKLRISCLPCLRCSPTSLNG